MFSRSDRGLQAMRGSGPGPALLRALLIPAALLLPAAAGEAALAALGQPPGTGNSSAPGSPAGPATALNLETQPHFAWRQGEAIPIMVETRRVRAGAISLAAGPFVEESRRTPLQLSFCLAETPNGPCTRPSIEANAHKPLWLVPTGSAEAGSYKGNVRIVADSGLGAEKPLTISVTGNEWRLWGLIALVAGVLLSFLLAVWMPHLRRRDLAIHPFALLAERLRRAEARLGPGEAPASRARASEIRAELTPARLEQLGLVPGRWPSPTAPADPGEELKRLFDSVQAQVAAIEMLAAAIVRAPDEDTRQALDALAAADDFPEDLEARIDAVRGLRSFADGATRAAEIPTPAELVAREETRNLLFWFVSAVVSVLVGYALLVDADPTFGGWTKVVGAFLWGLGVSTTGTKLAEMPQGNIRTALRPA